MDAKEIAEILTAREKTISVAEADTAGLIGYMLGAIPGSSKYFPGGIIAYTGGLKEKILGVADDVAPTHGTVSSEMAKGMARGRANFAAPITRCPPPASPALPLDEPGCPSAHSGSVSRLKTERTRPSRSIWTETVTPASVARPKPPWTCWARS